MRKVRRRDTPGELAIRRLLWREGLRYRVDSRPLQTLSRRADLVFRGPKLAVFVDGCFWHGCPDHQSMPNRNRAWWREKLKRNARRDRETDLRLREAGWQVLRIWEHEDPAKAALRVRSAVLGVAVDGS
jgi:DNA mismatch endonuclease (patch repair protein)